MVYTDISPLTTESMVYFASKINEYKIAKNVKFVLRKVPRPYTIPWNTSLIKIFETQHRQMYDTKPKDKHLILFIACVPGPYIQGTRTNIAGLAYDDTSFAIFIDNVNKCNQGIVLLHEMGHILGLVDIKSRNEKPINPERPSHCNDDDCNMFWCISSDNDDFCYKCMCDLKQLIIIRNSH
jgi:hypothetical protein